MDVPSGYMELRLASGEIARFGRMEMRSSSDLPWKRSPREFESSTLLTSLLSSWIHGRRAPPMEEEIILPVVAAFAAASARSATSADSAPPAPSPAPVASAVASTTNLAHQNELLTLCLAHSDERVRHGQELAAVMARATNAELAVANSSGAIALANQRADLAERRAVEWERRWEEERTRAEMADVEREARFRRNMAWEW